MTETTVTPARRTNPAFKGLSLIFKGLAFAVLAPMYPFAPRYTRYAMRTMGTMGTRIDLQMKADAVRHVSSDDAARQDALFDDLRAFVAADDWGGLSDRLAELDRDRARLTQSDHRLTDLALDFLRLELGDVVGVPNMCNFDYYYEIPDSVLNRIEAASRARPDDPWLTALLAQVHIDRGWCARGGGWSHEVTEAGWHALMNSFQTAYALLQRFDVEELNSPFYARVQFQLLASADAEHGLDHAREAYHNWSDLDVGNPLPHRTFAFFALPRWFGSWPSFEEEARAAMKRTEHIIGKAAYATFYLEAFEYDEDDALERLDVPLFMEALDDLIRRDSDPVCQAVRAAVLLGELTEPVPVTLIGEFLDRASNAKRDALRPMVKYIFETYVTHLPTQKDSEFEGRVLDQMTAAFAPDLKEGETVAVTPDGVRTIFRNT